VNQHREYEAGLKIAAKMIEPFEGFRSRPYWDPYGRVWTQGFGETRGITRQSRPISRREAHKRLINRLRRDFLPAIIEAARAQHDHATHPINRNRVAAPAEPHLQHRPRQHHARHDHRERHPTARLPRGGGRVHALDPLGRAGAPGTSQSSAE
jgi:hypothetical protein